MSDSDREQLRKEVEARLIALNNPRLSAAFAVRMALLALPSLAERVSKKGFLWYWKVAVRQKYLLAVCQALQMVCLVFFDGSVAASDRAAAAFRAAFRAHSAAGTAVAHAIYQDDIAAAASSASAAAGAAASAAEAASASYRASAARTAAAAGAAVYAARYAASASYCAAYAFAHAKVIPVIRQELECLKDYSDKRSYLTEKIIFPDTLLPVKESFLAELRKLPEFDYWADWLQDRYEGKPIDVELLKKSVLLPAEIKAQSPREINRYLKQLREGAEEKIKRVRAIFIGNGDAGKTSIIQALNNQTVKEGGTDMTAGIEISEWPVTDSDLTAHFWDFGGQVIAHATHQFFLRARCVYVLVLNARSADSNPNQQAEYWLEYVRAFGGDAPVLLIGNKYDLGPIHVDMHRLRDTYPNIQNFFPLSATEYQRKYADEFKIFKSSLCEQLRKVGEIQTYFTKTHFQVVETLREKSHKNPFLKKTTFDELCKEKDIDKETRESLLDLLDKLGEIIHFPELGWLDEYLLNPRWLTYGVYPLLYSECLKRQQGCLSKKNVADILEGHTVTDNQGNILKYEPERQDLLLHAMEQFKLCYPSPDNFREKTWIVPDLLPSDQPENLQFDNRNALRFEFDFKSFLPRHVLSRLIVEHYLDIWNHQVWQHGVHLQSKAYKQTEALVRANYQSRILSIEVAGQHIDRYFSALYSSVLKILEGMPKLQYEKWLYLDEKARMDNSQLVTPFEHPAAKADFDDLLALQAKGRKEYICKYGIYNLVEVLKLIPKEKQTMAEKSNTTNINIFGNGVVNSGNVSGNLINTINQLPPEKQDLKVVLSRLQHLLQQSELLEEPKTEALSKLKELTEAVHKPPAEKQTVLASVMGHLSGISGFLKAGKEIKDFLLQLKELFQ